MLLKFFPSQDQIGDLQRDLQTMERELKQVSEDNSLIVLEFFFREHQTNEIQAKLCTFLYLRLCSFREKKILQNPPPGTLPKIRLKNS